MKRWMKRLLLTLIPPLLLALIVVNVIDSAALLPWLAVQMQKHMAGLTVDNIRGSLQDDIHIDRLRIKSGRTLVQIDDVHAQIRWRCLLWGTVCVDKLHARQLLIDVEPSDEPAKPGTPLPTLETPVRLSWQQLAVDRLAFGDSVDAPHLEAIRSNGSWAGQKLFIDSGQLQYLQSSIAVDGNIIFSGGYPLDARAYVTNAATGVEFVANVGGEVARINAQLQVEKPLRAQGSATLSPLDSQLPYSCQLSLITDYVWRLTETTSITIADGSSIELQGDKKALGGELRAQATTENLNQPVQLNSPFQLDIATLVLTLSPQLNSGKTRIDGKATLAMSDDLKLDASTTAQHLDPGPWINGYDGDINANTTFSLLWRDGELTQAGGELNASGNLQQNNAQQDTLNLRASGAWDRQRGWKLTQADASLGKATARISAQGQGAKANAEIVATAPQAGAFDVRCDIDGIAEPTLRASCTQLAWTPPAEWKLPRWQNRSALRLQWAGEKGLATLAPFCLQADAASVCSDKELRWDNGALSAAIRISAIDLAWARAWLPQDYTLHGTVAGNIDVRSDAQKALNWSIKLATQNASATVPAGDHTTTITLQHFNASVDSDSKRMQVIVDAGAGDFGKIDGRLTMTPDQQLQGQVTLRNSSLTALQPLLPQMQIRAGMLQADVAIGGTRAAPTLNGSLQLAQGEIGAAQIPWPVKSIEARLAFEERHANLQASATINNQPVHASGEFDWQQALTGKMRLTTNELRITPLPRTDIWISPDLTATLENNVVNVSGRIDVPRAYIIIKELPKSGVPVSRDVVILSDVEKKKSAITVTGNIAVVLGDAVSFRGFGLQTRLDGQIDIGFKDNQPTGNGRVQLVDGRYRAYGQMLDINSGDLIFVGPLDNPVIRIDAIRSDVPEPNVVGVRASGELRNPDITLYSTPAMSERARLQYLLTGRAPDSESTESGGSILGQALLAFGAGQSEGVVAGVADKFGVHDVSLSTAEGTTGGTQVQLSAYLNSRLFLRYGKSVFDNANEITMRYQLTKSLFVEAVSGVANALDLLWTLEFGRHDD